MTNKIDYNDYLDEGNISIEACNEMNIPVDCHLYPVNNYWVWTASCYQPRRGIIEDPAFEVKSKNKNIILKLIRKKVLPLYKVAIKSLNETGSLYYWEVNK